MKTFAIISYIFVTMLAIAGTIFLFNFTKMPLGVLLAIGAGAVAVLWPVLRRLWLRLGVWFGVGAHVLLVGSLAMCAFLCINTIFRQPEAHVERGVVVSKFTKEHERRGGYRNRRVLGHYNTYHVMVALPDSTEVEYQITADRFRRVHTGRELDIEVTRGFFGYEVIDTRAF
ncbi:MAG: hypothetical protein HDS72_02245 [Bacteroidales bacterium]|nr:hypothetical protein [Bacteroidales bacterium]